MALKRNFLQPISPFRDLSTKRIILGVILGLVSALAIFLFAITIKDALYNVYLNFAEYPKLSTPQEFRFYKAVLGAFSLIWGQSVAINFIFFRPKKIIKRNYLKLAIINDHNSLIWYFIFWFSKMAISFWLGMRLILSESQYSFTSYPKYNYVFVLIIIILFLQSWVTIRRVYKRHSLKWMTISAIIILILSYSFTVFDIIDPNKIVNSYLNNNIHKKYELNIPFSNQGKNKGSTKSLTIPIYIVMDNDTPIVIVSNEIITTSQLILEIHKYQNKIPEAKRRKIQYLLHIDKKVKMKTILEVKKTLSYFSRGCFILVEGKGKIFERPKVIFSSHTNLTGIDSINLNLYLRNNIDSIHQTKIDYIDSSTYIINEKIIQKDQLVEYLKTTIPRGGKYVIFLNNRNEISVDQYIYTLSAIHETINSFRNDYTLKQFEKSYDDVEREYDYEKKKIIKDKFPIIIHETFVP